MIIIVTYVPTMLSTHVIVSNSGVSDSKSLEILLTDRQYRFDGLYGGHVIMLGPGCEEAALAALNEFPGGLQIGG